MKKILVVDDKKDTSDLVKFMLASASADYECDTANSGQDCLNLLENKTYDIILLDVHMPEMSGYEVLEELDNRGMLEYTKVIVFTATANLSEEKKHELKEKYKIPFFLPKPFTKKELLECLQQI